MIPGFELMVWRASLSAAPAVPRAIDLKDWSELVDRAGATAEAALFRRVASLWRGFALPRSAEPDGPPPWTIDLVIDELDELARAFTPADAGQPAPKVSGRPDEPGGIGPRWSPPALPLDCETAVARLVGFLASDDYDPGRGEEAVATLRALSEARDRLPLLDYRTMGDAPFADQCFAIAFAALAGFAADVLPLAVAPLGSAAFLHRVARLDPSGLGPYFGRVGVTARRSFEILDLARRASETGRRGAGDAWIALLARRCTGALLAEIIDDLGDGNRSTALSLLLDQMASRRALGDIDAIRHIRDACLDNAEWDLAARAQDAVVKADPTAYHERVILGSILATGGRYVEARYIFQDCLVERPDDVELARRLFLVRRDRFDGFHIVRGFASAAIRQDIRFRRRDLLPDHVARRGERIAAVNVD